MFVLLICIVKIALQYNFRVPFELLVSEYFNTKGWTLFAIAVFHNFKTFVLVIEIH